MHNYVKFDTVAFLKDYPSWKAELKQEKDRERDISIIKAPQTDKIAVVTSKRSDPTYSVALQKETVTKRIRQLERYIKIYDKVWTLLTPEDTEILKAFFVSKKRRGYSVQYVADKYGYSYPRGIYDKRGQILDVIRDFITNNYLRE